MTTVVRWNPFREMAAMQSALDRIFDDSWRSAWSSFGSGNTLAFDVHETDQAYTAVIALPGLTADQIDVRLEDGTLTVSGEIPQPTVPENARLLMQERTFGKFCRSIHLPQAVDASNVEASYENGILTLTLPKSPEAQPKQIPVKAGNNLLQSKN